MKTNDIHDSSLRRWVEQYMDEKRAERKAKRVSVDDLVSLWRERDEQDWAALREVLALRARCDTLCLEEEKRQLVIQRKLKNQSHIERNGVTYSASYSLGLEVAALRDLLGDAVQALPERSPSTIVQLVL